VARPPIEVEDDAVLVDRVGEGDAAAYRELVRRHARKLQHYALRVTGSASDAEDIVQETFMRLYQNASRYRPEARLTTWLHRVAHNLAIDHLRARGRTAPLEDELEPADVPPAVELVEEKRRHEDVAAVLAELPERQRAALALVYLSELSGAEAADVLGISTSAVESLLARGRRALSRRLAPRLGADA
jgi:RNA polymerase sigma-70 factor, ECF subfamily